MFGLHSELEAVCNMSGLVKKKTKHTHRKTCIFVFVCLYVLHIYMYVSMTNSFVRESNDKHQVTLGNGAIKSGPIKNTHGEPGR